MKKAIAVALLVTVVCGVAAAQQEKKGGETRVVIEQVQEKKHNYYSVRVGAWFPKDKEQGVQLDDIAINKTEGAIDESQALGVDFHFRKNIGHPFYTDLSAGAWYSSYEFKSNALQTAFDEYKAWTLIVPVTLGLSVAPLPENPVQPYAMVGLGAYFAFTSHDPLQVSEENELPDDTDTYIRFGYFAGLGVDFLLAETFGISAGVKYQFIKFDDLDGNKTLFTGQKDLTGLQATIGVVMMI